MKKPTNEDLLIELELLDQEIADKRLRRETIEAKLRSNLADEIAGQLSSNEYGCGTVNFDTDTFMLKAVVSKKVAWDQDKLSLIYEEIESFGDNPKKYIKRELKVSETAYKGWSDAIKSAFEPARTVTPSEPKISYERKKQ